MVFIWAACAVEVGGLAVRMQYVAGKARSLVYIVFCALRARGFFIYLVWAAFAAGGKAGPVMGLRPLLGPPCIPPEAPPFLPRPKNTTFRGRLRTNLADVSASVLYNAAPGNTPHYA